MTLYRFSLMARAGMVVGGAMALSACTTAPTVHDQLPVPEAVSGVDAWRATPPAWQGERQPLETSAWWLAFNDDALTALIGQSLLTHTSVRSAQAALGQSRALRDVSAAATWPVLGASGSAQRSAVGPGSPSSAFRAGLDASWEVDAFGARRSGLAANDADLLAAAAQLGQARNSLVAEVALTYLEWRTQQQRLVVARQNLAWQEEARQITVWRLQAGLASRLDLDQSLAVVSQTRAAIAPIESSVQQNRNALAVLVGLPPQAELDIPADGPIPQISGGWALGIPSDALRQRPDIQVAEARVLGAVARRDQAQAARYPGFSLSGSFDWRAPRLTDLLDAGALSRALVASVSASLLDGGADRARVRAQESALEQARISLEAAWVNALQEVESALLGLQAGQQRLMHLADAAAAAANAEVLARHRYASGLIDTRALLDAQRTRLNAESEQVSAVAAWSADHVRLYKALGGGWKRSDLAQDMKASLHEDH